MTFYFYVNLGFVRIIEYFIFVTHEFICLAAFNLTSQRQGGRQFHHRPLEPKRGRIQQQQRHDRVKLEL
jgi:hypothetical protein